MAAEERERKRQYAERSDGGRPDKGEVGQALKEGRALVREGGRTP